MSSRHVRVLAAFALTLTPVLAAAGQSISVSPFVSYIPSSTTNPLAGFALTFGGTTGLALRSGAEISISNPRLDSAAAQAGGIRPWGADADAMLFLGGLGGGATVFSRALSPYAFAGIGLTGSDSAGKNVVRNGWSYGAGATIPLGPYAGLFAEARWRMTEYVLPTSQGAPDSKSSMRFGLSFHVGGGSSDASRGSGRPRRHRMETADREDDDVQYVVTPAPAPRPVVVVTPAPSPEPEVVVVEEQPAPDPVTVIEREPAPAPVAIPTSRSRRRTTVVVPSRQPVLVTPERARATMRVYGRGTSRVRSQQVQIDRNAGARQSGASSAAPRVLQRAQSGASVGATRSLPTAQARAQARAQAKAATTRAAAAASTTTRRASNRARQP
jgi:hypothetical protein